MDEERERDDSGRFQTEYSDEKIISVVEEHEPAGTREIADELGIARQSADYRLRQLEEDGYLSKKKVGGTLIWSLKDVT